MTIAEYNNSLPDDRKKICELLMKEINQVLPEAESKLWHGAPVWFLKGNPLVGYWNRKQNVQLLFWSGQSFNEPDLSPEGKFKAAEIRYSAHSNVKNEDLRRWVEKSKNIQWDYKNIVKRRGELLRLV